jgi:carboxymethylenebutenolidase
MSTRKDRSCLRHGLIAAIAVGALPCAVAQAQPPLPERITFPSADGRTTLTGFFYAPRNAGAARVPAVVLLHGRAGPYSTLAHGVYDSATLSQRHQAWGRLWAERGYVALLVDSFGPRGFAQGFPRFSYDSRPDAVNEVTVRPLDAYGALTFLRSRRNVAADRIGLMGWSNGGSATLATMAIDAPGIVAHTPEQGFRAALAFYPACGLRGHFDAGGYRPYAPVRVLIGSADEEVSPRRCNTLVQKSRALGGDTEIVVYPGATHDFDDPGRRRQSVPANASAKQDATGRAVAFFRERLEAR